jgi:glucuronosyltransferase
MLKFSVLVFFVASTFKEAEPANILIACPSPSMSHQIGCRIIVKELILRHHNVTFITTDPIDLKHSNLSQIDVGFSYQIMEQFTDEFCSNIENYNAFQIARKFAEIFGEMVKQQFEYSPIRELIVNNSSQKFDLVISEEYNYFPLATVYKAPLIHFKSMEAPADIYAKFGSPTNPIMHPLLSYGYTIPLGFSKRFEAVVNYRWILMFKDKVVVDSLNKYYPGIGITKANYLDNLQLVMINAHPALFPRPLTPQIVQLGFMHIEDLKPLSIELQTFLDRSKHGVIYMSLGSNVKSSNIDPRILEVFVNTFRSLKYDVLWKWEADELPSRPSNVRISKWFPQADLLAHPNVKMFITQGGLQSLEEAISRTVPLLVIPFFMDQFTNAQVVINKKIGIRIFKEDLNEDELGRAIDDIFAGEYKENLEKLREIVFDQPITSREKAVWWIEYLLRHNNTKHFEYIGAKIPFYQKWWLDIVAVLIFIVYVIQKILRSIIRKSCKDSNREKLSKKVFKKSYYSRIYKNLLIRPKTKLSQFRNLKYKIVLLRKPRPGSLESPQ